MPGFLYYLPSSKPAAAVTLADVRAAGVGYAFDGRCEPRGVTGGPDGGNGVIVNADGERLGYYPDRQQWRKTPAPHHSPLTAHWPWVGWYLDEPLPGPEDLSRNEQLGGHVVKLGDGREWIVPVARGFTETDDGIGWYLALPATLELAESGEWTSGPVEERYQPLWAIAEAYWEHFSSAVRVAAGKATAQSGGEIAFDFQGLPDAAVVALQANYRIGRTEAALLGLFDDKQRKATAVMQALIDWPSWDEIVKKKLDQELLHSAAGPAAERPATAPRS